jgi:class 3 adenylate cyclase
VSADPAAAPSGVVTFVFTDIEGSTRRWESDANAMRAALLVHDQVLRTAIETHGGYLFSHTGDGVVAAFASPKCAVDAAVAEPAVNSFSDRLPSRLKHHVMAHVGEHLRWCVVGTGSCFHFRNHRCVVARRSKD